MTLGIKTSLFNLNKDQIKKSLRSRLSLPEFFSLLLLGSLIVIFTIHHHQGYYQPWDYKQSYLPAGAGDYSNFFYAYWIMPVFWLLEKIPFPISYSIWAILNVLSTLFASRVFGGRSWLAIFSYQMIYVIFYGQITGILVGGLALAWLSMANKNYHMAGLGFLIASIKPQFGLPLGLIIWLLADLSWKERISILFVPLLGIILTFLVYPHWIQNILIAIQNGKVDKMGDISIWQYLGPWSLIFFLPPLIIRLQRSDRILLLIATAMFALPYFQQTGLLALYVFPFGWLSLLGNLGLLFPIFEWGIFSWFFLVPLSIYIFIFVQHLLDSKQSKT